MGSSVGSKNNYRLILYFLASVLVSLPIEALGCADVDGAFNADCEEIVQSSLPYADQQQLLAGIIYPGTGHGFIREWNGKISYNEAPYGATVKNSIYIRKAWLKIASIMPSVINNSLLLIHKNGSVVAAYNYDLEIPSGKAGSDCKTEYHLSDLSSKVSIYHNGILLGNSAVAEFSASTDAVFEAKLFVAAVVAARHYRPYRWCCRYDRSGGCKNYCEECRYEWTEYNSDSVNLMDSKMAQYYESSINLGISVLDNYRNTTVGLLNASDFSSLSLNFLNSSYTKDNYYFDINLSMQPYDVFTLRANPITYEKADNIIVQQANDSFRFYVSNIEGCKIEYRDFFNARAEACSLEKGLQPLGIRTNRLEYDEGEKIDVYIEPANIESTLKYGTYEISARGKAQFTAQGKVNRIYAYGNGRTVSVLINVKKKAEWDNAINFGLFSGILYFVYYFFRKFGFYIQF